MNQGLKEYTKQIGQTIGNVAEVSVNVNKEDANMHIVIPLIETLGPNPLEVSLIYNYQDRDLITPFGKGCNINTYKDFADYESYIYVKDADGSSVKFWDEDGVDKFTSKENSITIVKNTISNPGDSDEYTYEFRDPRGNKICYNNGVTYYPTSIEYINGEKTTFNGMDMDNGRGAKVSFIQSNRLVTRANYTQDGTILYYITFGYNSNQQLTSVSHYKESKLVKQLSISYSNAEIVVKDEISKDYVVYSLVSNRIETIKDYVNGKVDSVKTMSLVYEDKRTTITDNDNKKLYIYFDNNNFPLLELDEDGNAVRIKYDATTKKLISESSVIPTKNKLDTLASPTINAFSKSSGIKTSHAMVTDTVLSGILGAVYSVSGTGTLSYSYSTKGLGGDSITAVIWGKQLSNYSNTSKVSVRLTADGTVLDEFKKTTIDGNFEMMTLGVTALSSYSTITLTLTFTGSPSIVLGGIQILKKDFGAFYKYDDNGAMTNYATGKGSISSVYNAKGLQTSSLGKDSTLYNYKYDSKGNLKSARTAYGGKIENSYDSYNNVVTSLVTNADGTKQMKVVKTYQDGRFVESEIDELNNKTNYTYDSFGKIKKVTDALSVKGELSATTEYFYDEYDNITKILFNNSIAVNYAYDSQQKIKKATLPNGTIYSFDYDSYNNLNRISMNDVEIVSFTYDPTTGLIKEQSYKGSTYNFIYNDKHDIKEIKHNGDVIYTYTYDKFDRLEKVANGFGETLKSYTYDNDGQVITTNENGCEVEYNYDNLGGITQRKRTLNSKKICESFDPISRSKGFSPDNLIGYLQNRSFFLGTLFSNNDGTLKSNSYACNPINYKTNGITDLNFKIKDKIPCVDCNLVNPISFYPPMGKSNVENSGCVGFWFYPTSAPASSGKKYLFSLKNKNLSDYIAVYMNSSRKLILELNDGKNIVTTKETTTYVNLNNWNFFGLNFAYRDDGQGYAQIFSYELYLNSECKQENLSNKVILTGSVSAYHIGYRYDGVSGHNALECEITALMIGLRLPITTQQMKNFYAFTKDYMFGSSYLDGDSVDFSVATLHNISDTMLNQFEIYPLQNDVKSLKGKTPSAFDLRRISETDKDRTFNYNNQIKRYAFVADGNRLEYIPEMTTTGTIMMRVFLRENAERQYLLDCKDGAGNTIGLYRAESHYLFVEVNDSIKATDFKLESNEWHTIGFSFTEGMAAASLNSEKSETIRVYFDGLTQTITKGIQTSFGSLTLSVGRKAIPLSVSGNLGEYEEYYPLLGQIEMLATRAAYCEVTTLNALSNELKPITKRSEYDELGMLQKTAIRNGNTDILTNAFSYRRQTTNSVFISKQIEKETIKYGSSTVERIYTKLDDLRREEITDSTFGSHRYEYNARWFLTKEDSTEYEYDDNGNITKAGNTIFAYDKTIKDRLEEVSGTVIEYDDEANPLNPTSWEDYDYTWEGRRLTSVLRRDGIKFTYTYNEHGLRIRKQASSGSTTNYYYDSDKLITEITPEYRLDFLYDENNLLYGFIYNKTDKYYYIRDILQNILGIVDNNGNLVVKYSYTAYGKITSTTGSQASTIGTYNPFRYKGYYYDSETGLYLVTTRYYNPEWCRFISPDSIEYLDPSNINGMNLYAYCGNDPVNRYDPTGHSWESFWSGVGNWFSDHWVKLAIGAGAVALGVLTMGAAALISGAGIVGALSAMGTAAVSSLVQVGISTAISAGIGFVVGGMTTGSWDGALNGMLNGIADGIMWGGIFAGAGQVLSGAMKITRTLAPNFNGIRIGNLKIWSPNSAINTNAGGTLFKFGKFNRIDAEIGNMIHIHLKLFGHTFNHLPIGMILGGILGGF